MKIVYEENNSNHDEKYKYIETSKEKVTYNGNTYTYLGKYQENPAVTTRVRAFIACFFMTLAAITVVPLFFEGFRKTITDAGIELFSGKQIVEHYVINPDTPDATNDKPKQMTSEELRKKGLEDSQGQQFD